jgi:hypothetical protein
MATDTYTHHPLRIQRKRTKGWRMPDGAVYCGRPTKWGNWASTKVLGLELSLVLFRDSALGIWDASPLAAFCDSDVERLYECRHEWLKRIGCHPTEAIRRELRGRQLACWCPLTHPCHVDCLAEIANQ